MREPMDIQGIGAPTRRAATAAELLVKCGVSATFMHRFPNEFSGGQQQRIGIAPALTMPA